MDDARLQQRTGKHRQSVSTRHASPCIRAAGPIAVVHPERARSRVRAGTP